MSLESLAHRIECGFRLFSKMARTARSANQGLILVSSNFVPTLNVRSRCDAWETACSSTAGWQIVTSRAGQYGKARQDNCLRSKNVTRLNLDFFPDGNVLPGTPAGGLSTSETISPRY